MTSTTTYVSLHDRRVRLVADALVAHSALGEEAALEAAVHAVYALDHIPETVRWSGR
jgi:hypothetical protein